MLRLYSISTCTFTPTTFLSRTPPSLLVYPFCPHSHTQTNVMPSQLPPSSSSLRFASFNVGLAFARKLPEILTHCCSLSLDVVALQEIGDPAIINSKLAHYTLYIAPGPSHHDAGVGFLLSHALTPFCRAFRRSPSGRLMGITLEMKKGCQVLMVSAYMPTGIDHRSAADEQVQLAHQLYSEILQWSNGVKQVILMGDLNETLTPFDRSPTRHLSAAAAAAASSSPIHCLEQEGFCDTFRSLFPIAASHPGFTHEILTDRRHTRSRIDYIWTRGFLPRSHLHCSIHRKLHRISNHHLLILLLQLDYPAPHLLSHELLLRIQLPNLRSATDENIERFTTSINEQLHMKEEELLALSLHSDCDSITSLASQLNSLTHEAAFSTLPLTGAKPFLSKPILSLHRQRLDLTRLLHHARLLHAEGKVLARSPEWVHLLRICRKEHHAEWKHRPDNAEGWMMETQSLIAATRADIAKEVKRMQRVRPDHYSANPTATVHQMLRGQTDTHLLSIVNSDGELTTTPEELKSVMVDHFQSVFALPPSDPRPLPHPGPPPAMLFNKPGIVPSWFDGLMADVAGAELLCVLKDTPLTSAPGEDQVSTGVWKLALQGSERMRELVAALFNQCLHSSTFPCTWKTSVILPFVKDQTKERSMSNIRPISLQNCLGKLFNKLLAHRLGSILTQHPILNPSQRGFVPGGTSVKCIDELLDAWRWSRENNKELYTLFYDIKQAYDSVQGDVLVRALNRIHLPPAFVELIRDSLRGLSSCVRTAYGESSSFPVRRSVRQGDPLAPLLFVILMDALHDGLEVNPFTGSRHGCLLTWPGQSVYWPSVGYADDSLAAATSLPDLCIQNNWVEYFMRFNSMLLNALKCELVGRRADGHPVTAADVAAHDITVCGHALQPLAHDQPIRYLGAHSCFDGSWAKQQQKSRETIMLFTRTVSKFNLSISKAVHLFNIFLLPRLELSLHYVHGPGTRAWIADCDRILIGCLKHAASSPIRLSHTALALALNLTLPSWLEASVKVSELFLRLNSSDPRWGFLGRITMLQQCGASVDSSCPLSRADTPKSSLMRRTAYLAVHKLGWKLSLDELHRSGSRHRHLAQAEPLDSLPDVSQCSSSALVDFSDGPTPIAHDHWTGWGKLIAPLTIHLYTDGSHVASPQPQSAWSVVAADRWLDDNFGSVPSDEQLLTPAHTFGATLTGSSISCTQGVYPAELQAIARALAMFPLRFQLHIHSDSKASIAAVARYEHSIFERERLRMQARPILFLIHHLLTIRREAGGDAQLHHVKAHTDGMDIDSVGNRLADYQAERARSKPDRSRPLNLAPLPLSSLEPHFRCGVEGGLQVIDDIRRTSRLQLRASALVKWKSKADQAFASLGAIDLGRVVLKHGSAAQQRSFVHLATNSFHFYWPPESDEAPPALQQVHCNSCDDVMTITHASDCPSAKMAHFRDLLQSSISTSLVATKLASVTDWLHANRHLTLSAVLLRLFPPPPAAPPDEIRRHTARCMIGAFTLRESNAADKLLGIPRSNQHPSPLERVRLLCVDHFAQVSSSLKPASLV